MKLSLTLSLTMALSIASFLRDGFGRSSSHGQVSDSEKKLALPEKQLPIDIQCQASSWPCRLGLTPCPRWVRYRVSRVVIAEVPKKQAKGTEQEAFRGPWWPGLSVYPIRIWNSVRKMVLPQEQQPAYTEHQASNWTCSLGLSSCLKWLQYRISRAVVTEGPKQQPLDTNQKTFKGPCWPGLSVYSIRIWKWVSKMVLPEKQLPVDTEHQASNWPCRLGLSPCPRWVRYRVSRVIVTEGLKQELLGTEQKSFSLPYLLDQLWDYIAQGALARLIMEGLLIIFIQCLLRVAHGLWR